jgi:hypothetical protein
MEFAGRRPRARRPLSQCFRAAERRSNDSAGRRNEQLVAARPLSERSIVFERCEGCWICPEAAVRAVPGRLLLLCLLLRSSWLTAEGGREIGAAGVLHRRGGRAAVAVSVGVAGGVPEHSSRAARSDCPRLLAGTRSGRLPTVGRMAQSRLLGHAGLLAASRQRGHAVGADLVAAFRAEQRPLASVRHGRSSGKPATPRSTCRGPCCDCFARDGAGCAA